MNYTNTKGVNKKLRNKIFLYSLVFLISTGILAFDLAFRSLPITYAIGGLIFGIIFGLVTKRMFLISWDEKNEEAIAKVDYLGGIIFLIYIFFELNRDNFVSIFVHGPAISGVSIAILSGIMLYRVVSMRQRIISIVKENLSKEE